MVGEGRVEVSLGLDSPSHQWCDKNQSSQLQNRKYIFKMYFYTLLTERNVFNSDTIGCLLYEQKSGSITLVSRSFILQKM
jgi:hypothetical protein